MIEVVLLDAGPLGLISHPRARQEIVEWLARQLAAGVTVLIPEIADYEVRRELLRAGRSKGVKRLDAAMRFPHASAPTACGTEHN